MISRSLTTGASSIKAHQRKFDTISNNIANVNTTGYKSSRTNFLDQFSQTYNFGKAPDAVNGKGVGGVNPFQYGLGVRVGSVTQDMTQGSLETTNRPLDMALQGDGYLVYNQFGKEVYSRAGAIVRDKAGNLVDSSTGAFLQGFNSEIDANGRFVKDANGYNKVLKTQANMKIPATVVSPPKQTENITATGNLNSAAVVGETRETSISIFDNSGSSHNVTLTYTNTAQNTWGVTAKLDGKYDITPTPASITFTDYGVPAAGSEKIDLPTAGMNTALNFTAFDVAKANVTVTLFDAANPTTGMTQFAGANTATLSEQDGHNQGTLSDLSVDSTGKIWGAFTNGEAEVLGQVAVAKFANPGGLIKNGENFLSVSPDSGSADVRTAGDGFPTTKLIGGALEQSNVDLTEQFTDMIITQRGFEAAARTITVSDQMLAETNQLKR